jgi:hypothetical protein
MLRLHRHEVLACAVAEETLEKSCRVPLRGGHWNTAVLAEALFCASSAASLNAIEVAKPARAG